MTEADAPLKEPGVEANARLTGTTGLVLLVMLATEGITIASIRPLLPWHIAIGLALIPPVALKLGSTLWRFGRYYLGDPRYRRAGPPHPLLRTLGPVVVLTTVVVLASGVALWIAGPSDHLLLTVHKASFVIWFAAMTVHVLAHLLRATRLTRADVGPRPGRQRPLVPYPRVRQGLVLASLVAGVAVGVTTRGLAGGWTLWIHHAR